jgi:hypothetical protein
LFSLTSSPGSPPPDDYVLQRSHVRELTEQYKRGNIPAFVRLVRLLLSETVAAQGWEARVHATYPGRDRTEAYLGGPLPKDLIRLRDGRWLRLAISVYVEQRKEGPYQIVRSSSYQYQATQDHQSWIFRYDYLRESPLREPGAHLQVRGALAEAGVLPEHQPLANVQFPTRRVSIEAIIRLLAIEFGVPCRSEPARVNALLSEAEAPFMAIAHEPDAAQFPQSSN